MRVARVLAQAKVNLWLKVGGRDPESGYHDVATLFQRLDLADEVVVRVGGSVRSIDCSGPTVPPGGLGAHDKNLAFRAAMAYSERAGWPRGFSIELTKNIPVGGGLGGGSADAGAVLRALDAVSARPLGAEALMEMAGSIGSDVPFLTCDFAAALAGGRGERLEAVEPLDARDVVLVVPDFAISTADAYRWLDESVGRREQRAPWQQPTPPFSWETAEGLTQNDFEPCIEDRHPELRTYRERLRSVGARIARLSGSGSTVFGVFEGPAPALRDLGAEALVLHTRTSSRVVQVEVLE